jgi:EAL domain-containing protein (putative c-di-GMP-specific phosphodiesterase class I)/FixJ family two-component response regulator
MKMTIAPAIVESEASTGPVVYIFDDDSRICMLISRMLHAAGYVALSFTKPDQGLAQLRTADAYKMPKVIILDLSLDGTDGIEVLNELKAHKYSGRVLLVSGRDEATLLEVERMGMVRGFAMLPSLKKPFQLDDLIKRLKIEVPPVKSVFAAPTAKNQMSALERAVSGGELIFRYQPRMDLNSGIVRGAEVVVYEQNPSDGLVPLATSSLPSNSPILHPLSRALFRTVMDDWSRHLSDVDTPIGVYIKLPLSVVTTGQFGQFVRKSMSANSQFKNLIIEVNDWHQFNNVTVVRDVSAQLKLYGVGLSTGEIGALHSAITESYRFPFSEFKLSPNLILNCATNQTKQALCRSTINLAHEAGASVCAEGVASRDELETVVAMGCDTALGALFGSPQSMEVFKAKYLAPRVTQTESAIDSAADPFQWPEAVPAR